MSYTSKSLFTGSQQRLKSATYKRDNLRKILVSETKELLHRLSFLKHNVTNKLFKLCYRVDQMIVRICSLNFCTYTSSNCKKVAKHIKDSLLICHSSHFQHRFFLTQRMKLLAIQLARKHWTKHSSHLNFASYFLWI